MKKSLTKINKDKNMSKKKKHNKESTKLKDNKNTFLEIRSRAEDNNTNEIKPSEYQSNIYQVVHKEEKKTRKFEEDKFDVIKTDSDFDSQQDFEEGIYLTTFIFNWLTLFLDSKESEHESSIYKEYEQRMEREQELNQLLKEQERKLRQKYNPIWIRSLKIQILSIKLKGNNNS